MVALLDPPAITLAETVYVIDADDVLRLGLLGHLAELEVMRLLGEPLTDAVIVAWREDLGSFDDHAWIIPAIDPPRLVSTAGYTFRLPLWISASKPSRFDPYRVERARIAAILETRVAPESSP